MIPLRIFISYGHDEHVMLAMRLRDDLRDRGHAVWFDEDRLHPGHDWESIIESGLEHLAADRSRSAVVLLLTPHSVRRPDGYCLNEVSRALARGLRIIPLMVVESEPPLSICRIQWLDMRECIPITEKGALYTPKLGQLLRALEEGELETKGIQSRLLGVLEPIQFSADVVKLLRDFTGRQWVIAEVDQWLHNPAGSKVFWITGAPGVGKSAISAWIRDHRHEVAAFHFCDINSEEKRSPAKMVRSLVYQLSTQLRDYQERLSRLPLENIVRDYHEAYTLFEKLLIQPLSDQFPKPDRTIVVLIDALDEATYQRQNEIVRFLTLCADKTPSWLRFLVTSRPEPEIVASFQALSPYVLDTAKAENIDDLRAFMCARLPTITRQQADIILERSEGVFLYVRHVMDALIAGHLSLARLDEFPRGLGDIFQQFFHRQFGSDLEGFEEKITPLLQPILAAFEPLTLGLLKRQCGNMSDTELGRRFNRLGSLFPATGGGDADTIRPFHRSLCDWITDRESAGHYSIAVSDGHRGLADHGWRQYEKDPERMDDYFIQWLPAHLFALGDDVRMTRLLKDFRYLIEKVRRGMLERLLADYRGIPGSVTTSTERLEVETSFFQEKAHILRRGNDDWPAHKILLQLAIEHADESALTLSAERWIADERCDWFWWKQIQRSLHPRKNFCIAVLEGHGDAVGGALELVTGKIISWSSWSKDTTLRVWDGSSGACLAVLAGHTERVRGALPMGGDRFLSWSWDESSIRLWNAATGACIKILSGHTGGVLGALALDGERILSWSRDHTLRLWDLSSSVCDTVFHGHSDRVAGAMVLSDGRILSWSWDATLKIWNISSGECMNTLEGHADVILNALELTNGTLLSWAWDGTLRRWDSQKGICLAVFEGHSKEIKGATQLTDGRILSWGDKTLRIWDPNTGDCSMVLSGHDSGIRGAIVLTDGQLISWSSDATSRIWDVATGNCTAVLTGHTAEIKGAMKLPTGRLLTWSRDRTIRLWDPFHGTCLAILDGHTDAVVSSLMLSNGHLVSWSWDKTLRLWTYGDPIMVDASRRNSTDEQETAQFSECCEPYLPPGKLPDDGGSARHLEAVLGAVILTNGRLASWSRDRFIRLWDVTSGACLKILKPDTNPEVVGVLPLAGARLLSWGGQILRIWDGEAGACLSAFMGHVESCNGAIRLTGERFMTWGGEALKLWDERDGTCISVLDGHRKGHQGFVRGAREMPDGRLLVWSSDGSLRLWDANDRLSPLLMTGHIREIRGAATLSDGTVVSWSADGTIRIWDPTSGDCLAVLKENEEWIIGTAELDNHRLLSWSENQKTRNVDFQLWDLKAGACVGVFSETEAARIFPDWLHLRNAVLNGGCEVGSFTTNSFARSACLWHKSLSLPLAVWHGESDTNASSLLSDGTAVVTQMNGEVSILKLHHGHRRISLAEAEAILVERGELSASEASPQRPESRDQTENLP